MKNFAVVLLCVLTLFSACDSQRYRDEDDFQIVQKRLMASVTELTQIPSDIQLTDEPYITGKLALFQRGDHVGGSAYSTQMAHFRELKESYAATPEEVKTVVLLDCRMVQKGVYRTDDGQEFPATVEDCQLTMIDRSRAAVVYRKRFEKTPQQDRKVVRNMVLAESAQTDVLQFLKALPRR
jgi:hypothetical protein